MSSVYEKNWHGVMGGHCDLFEFNSPILSGILVYRLINCHSL